MMGFVDDMTEAEPDWDATPTNERTGGGLFSPGRHQAIITESRVEEGQYGWQFVLQWRGTDSLTRGQALATRWDNLPPHPERAEFLKTDLATLGYTGPLGGLEQACIDGLFIGKICNIFVKKNERDGRIYTNVYLNDVLPERVDPDEWLVSRGAGVAGDNGYQHNADDDIPF